LPIQGLGTKGYGKKEKRQRGARVGGEEGETTTSNTPALLLGGINVKREILQKRAP